MIANEYTFLSLVVIAACVCIVLAVRVCRGHQRNKQGESDDDYDDMKRDSPTQAVGSPSIGGTAHATPMRSLQNARNEDELRDFFNRIRAKIGATDFIIEPKIDGIALNVTYSNYELVSCVTKGDGGAGKDVTDNIYHIMPATIKLEAAEIRGEVCIAEKTMAGINKGRLFEGMSLYKTCQSAAIATLMWESAAVCKARKLKFVAYDMGYGKAAKTQSALCEQLKRMGFATLPHSKVRTFDGMLRASKRMFTECKLPTDGAVIKLDDIDGQIAMGVTKQAPRHAIAWKGVRYWKAKPQSLGRDLARHAKLTKKNEKRDL